MKSKNETKNKSDKKNSDKSKLGVIKNKYVNKNNVYENDRSRTLTEFKDNTFIVEQQSKTLSETKGIVPITLDDSNKKQNRKPFLFKIILIVIVFVLIASLIAMMIIGGII